MSSFDDLSGWCFAQMNIVLASDISSAVRLKWKPMCARFCITDLGHTRTPRKVSAYVPLNCSTPTCWRSSIHLTIGLCATIGDFRPSDEETSHLPLRGGLQLSNKPIVLLEKLGFPGYLWNELTDDD